ncbi:MAG: CHAT domain-containing protein [Cyanobacteria bacterium P01_G01_bin.67]
MTVYTQDSFPYKWAMTQNGLGTAYQDRILGDRKDNIESAIIVYKAALTVYTEINFPNGWAGVQHNLSTTFTNRIAGSKEKNLESAISACKAALKVRTETDYPEEWAMIQNHLGIAYFRRIKGNRMENVELAIAAFKAALRVRTKANYPEQWAKVQTNIAIAYSERIAGERLTNIDVGVNYYRAALTVFTAQNYPIDCLNTSHLLGNLYFKERNWHSAIEAYNIAINAVEQSREWASNEQNKQEVISNALEVYQNTVKAYINLSQTDKAIEYVERSKARNLVDLLSTRDLSPKGDIPQFILDRLYSLKKEVIAEEKKLSQQRSLRRSSGSFSDNNMQDFKSGMRNDELLNCDRLNQVRQELDDLVEEHIQPFAPSFQLTRKVKPIGFEKIQQTLPNQKTAFVEWFISNDNLSVFVVTSKQTKPIHIAYSEAQLQASIDTANEYYDSYRERDKQWRNNLPNLLSQLAKHLQLSIIIEQIKQIIPDCNQLILVPHRWLHLFPIHALPLDDGKCLLDLFPQGVSYAPSVQLLESTQKQVRTHKEKKKFFAVQNPTEDLEFTNIEVQSIRTQFQPHDDVLIEQQATKSTLLNQATLGQADLTHFSCHGYFNFENPELSALLMAGSKVDKEEGEEEDKVEGVEKKRFLPSRDGGNIDLEQCLTLGEIFGLDLRNCRLVTLSACETGLTDFKSLSDEYIGLPSGFLYAGSPSVVSSLWTVSDLSTTFLMIKFYQNLQEIDSVAIALNQAQLWLRSVTKEGLEAWQKTLDLPRKLMYKIIKFISNVPPNTCPFASPYHWGAFCAVGS